MRADYHEVAEPNVDEERKLDKYWTDNWLSIGNRRRALWRLKVGPEYPVVMKTAPKPVAGQKVLDGGCGLGEWCLLLKETG